MSACRECGSPVEAEREDYAVPTCFRCLPPPAPLPIRPTFAQLAADIERSTSEVARKVATIERRRILRLLEAELAQLTRSGIRRQRRKGLARAIAIVREGHQ